MEIEILDTAPIPKKNSYLGKLLLGTIGVASVSLTVITLPFVLPAVRKTCLPYVPASQKAVDNVFKLIMKHKPESACLVDLGSGDGRIVMEGAKRGYKSVGVELNPWLVAYSKYRAFPLRKMATFYCNNLWKFDIKPYNVIIIFGVEEMMPKLRQHIIQQKYETPEKSADLSLSFNASRNIATEYNRLDTNKSTLDLMHNRLKSAINVQSDVLVVCSRFKFDDCRVLDVVGVGMDTAWAFQLKNLKDDLH